MTTHEEAIKRCDLMMPKRPKSEREAIANLMVERDIPLMHARAVYNGVRCQCVRCTKAEGGRA